MTNHQKQTITLTATQGFSDGQGHAVEVDARDICRMEVRTLGSQTRTSLSGIFKGVNARLVLESPAEIKRKAREQGVAFADLTEVYSPMAEASRGPRAVSVNVGHIGSVQSAGKKTRVGIGGDFSMIADCYTSASPKKVEREIARTRATLQPR